MGITTNQTARLIEWLIGGWHDGLGDRFSRSDRFSIFILRYKVKDLVDAFGVEIKPRVKKSGPDEKIQSVEDFLGSID